MRLPWHWRAEARRNLAEAREQRETAERRLAEAHEHVILPLRELREKNHVAEAITMLIQRGGQERLS
jgi:sulfur relay (sulfurtransferase) DsrC/TusE family protein